MVDLVEIIGIAHGLTIEASFKSVFNFNRIHRYQMLFIVKHNLNLPHFFSKECKDNKIL